MSGEALGDDLCDVAIGILGQFVEIRGVAVAAEFASDLDKLPILGFLAFPETLFLVIAKLHA